MWFGNIKFPEFWATVGWKSCSQNRHTVFLGHSFLTLFEEAEFLCKETHTHPTMSPAVHGLCDCESRMWSAGLRLKSPPVLPCWELCDPKQSLSLSEPVSSSMKHSLIICEVLLFQLVVYWDLQTPHFRTYYIHLKVNSVWSLWLFLHEKTSKTPPRNHFL